MLENGLKIETLKIFVSMFDVWNDDILIICDFSKNNFFFF